MPPQPSARPINARPSTSHARQHGWESSGASSRCRWLIIGQVERRYVVFTNQGFPDGLVIHWRGRVDWCQPWEFLDFDRLLKIVRIRLAMARLCFLEHDLEETACNAWTLWIKTRRLSPARHVLAARRPFTPRSRLVIP